MPINTPQMDVDIAPFPDGAQMNLADFIQWLENNIKINVPEGFLIGHIGEDEPPPNSGPWQKGDTWYLWDAASATYIPQLLRSEVGKVDMFAYAGVDLAHYVRCDGSAIPRAAPYDKLFSKIGTTYGNGDGSSTFNVPSIPADYLPAFNVDKHLVFAIRYA
jgi:hypothetical protein